MFSMIQKCLHGSIISQFNSTNSSNHLNSHVSHAQNSVILTVVNAYSHNSAWDVFIINVDRMSKNYKDF